jgi:hypothetical protein
MLVLLARRADAVHFFGSEALHEVLLLPTRICGSRDGGGCRCRTAGVSAAIVQFGAYLLCRRVARASSTSIR